MTGSKISKLVSTSVTLGVAGYSSPLTITKTGTIEPVAAGATALYAPASLGSAVVTNHGSIVGGAGAYGLSAGGAGGIGVDLAATGVVLNTGVIEGGLGSASGNEATSGAGGAAIILAAGGTLTNHGDLIGGAGGAGSPSFGNTGGAGGYGAIIAVGAARAWISRSAPWIIPA